MRLVTYSWKGRAALGALANDRVVDLHRAYRATLRRSGDSDESDAALLRMPSDVIGFLCGSEKSMAAAKRALQFVEDRGGRDNGSALCHGVAELEMLPPIQRPGKIVCVGLNYRSHLAEIGEPVPEYPILFLEPAGSIITHGRGIVLPRVSRQVDYESELALVIGRPGEYIPRERALDYVAGYTCANDVSANDIEFRTSQWTSGKMLDTFCSLGPVLVTRDEVPNLGSLRLRTLLNGRVVQDATTADMVFPVDILISYISSLTSLEVGDVILTGTPGGIGCNQQPQVFLKAGDHVCIEIDGIGTLDNPVVAEEGR